MVRDIFQIDRNGVINGWAVVRRSQSIVNRSSKTICLQFESSVIVFRISKTKEIQSETN